MSTARQAREFNRCYMLISVWNAYNVAVRVASAKGRF
jgi:hypothetical protein